MLGAKWHFRAIIFANWQVKYLIGGGGDMSNPAQQI